MAGKHQYRGQSISWSWYSRFDYFLAKALSPNNVSAPTGFVQAALYKQWKGFAPPGSCTLIPLKGSSFENNPPGCAYIALCPTMRIPGSVTWNREIVYNLMWSILVSLEQHNAAVDDLTQIGTGVRIRKVVMTGLGTGVGGISSERFAQQMALAVKHFLDASANPEKWSSLSWDNTISYDVEIRRTHALWAYTITKNGFISVIFFLWSESTG